MAGRKHTAFLVITAVLLCLAVLSPFLFIVIHSEHDCTHDDDCAVCRMIDAYIHRVCFDIAFAAAAALAALAVLTAVTGRVRARCVMCADTLILMKTELRN